MKNSLSTILLGGALALSLASCSNDDDDPVVVVPNSSEYTVSVTNLTNFQIFSPTVAILHDSSTTAWWSIGSAASVALEEMAEGGDGSALLALTPNNPNYKASGGLLPGITQEFTITSTDSSEPLLSLAGMFINTNDAFSGLNAVDVSAIATGQSKTYYTNAYDAGTENNTEAAGTIPGPADDGEGFNAARDDVTSVVTYHSGVVTTADFAGSTLDESAKFDNATLKIVITKM